MNAAAVALTVAKSATVKHKANTKHIQAGKERKKGMIAPLNVSKGQENKATSYRFGDDERELTAEEKEEQFRLRDEYIKEWRAGVLQTGGSSRTI